MKLVIGCLITIHLAFSVSCVDKEKVQQTKLQKIENHIDDLNMIDKQNSLHNFIAIDKNGDIIKKVKAEWSGNSTSTNHLGVLSLDTEATSITLSAKGFITTTFNGVTELSKIFELAPSQEQSRLLEVQGNTSGFGKLKRDKRFDFSIVLPAFTRSSLVNFDVSNVLSAESDQIKVPTKTVSMPTNITLPKQSEKYIFFTIKFNKPQYKLFVPKADNYTLFASHGSFPMKDIMDAVKKGQSMYSMLNKFSFKQGGLRKSFIPDDISGQDLVVNQIQYNSSLTFRVPQIQSDQVIIGASFMNKEGQLLPTDLKSFKSEDEHQLKINSENINNSYILSILKEDDLKATSPQFKQVSMSIQAHENINTLPIFLGLVNKPQIENKNITVGEPITPKGLNSHSVTIYLSEIEKITYDDVESEKRTVIHKVINPGWANSFDISQVSYEKKANRTYRWEVIFMAAPETLNINLDYYNYKINQLESVTHTSANSVDL